MCDSISYVANGEYSITLLPYRRKSVVVLIATKIGENITHCGIKQHQMGNLHLKPVVRLSTSMINSVIQNLKK